MTDATDTPQTSPENRLKTELRALGRCLMPHDENSHVRKGITLVLLVLWVGWSVGRAHGFIGNGDVVLAGYTAYRLFTYATIYAFARLHKLEVQNLLGGKIPVKQGQGGQSDDGDGNGGSD